jgi:hypothetical protein
VIRERRAGGKRVLNRRKLFDLRWGARPIPVVEVIAEEVLVVLVVPGVAFLRGGLLFLFFLCGFDWLELFGGTSSSIGFSTISWLRSSDNSSVDIGSSLIACCSDGVRISFWTSLVWSF